MGAIYYYIAKPPQSLFPERRPRDIIYGFAMSEMG